MSDTFRIDYRNPRAAVPQPDRFDGYDVVSAYYDYEPSAPAVTLRVCDYSLELDGRLLIDWMRSSLKLAERILAGTADDWPDLRAFLPELASGTRVHMWIASDIAFQPPVLAFAVDGQRVLIYTRSYASETVPRLVLLEGDREAPCIVGREAVLEAIATSLTQYLDDLVEAFPFLVEDEIYQSQRERIGRLLGESPAAE